MKRLAAALFIFAFITVSAFAEVPKYKRQTIYVPVYSHIYVGSQVRPFDLAVTLSIRNTNADESIIITVADYYDSEGKLVKPFLNQSHILKPMATLRFPIPETDREGGSGANFIVKWHAEKPVNAPLVESVMIGTRSQQGISFTSRGVVIED